MAGRGPGQEASTSCNKVSKSLQRDHAEALPRDEWKSATS